MRQPPHVPDELTVPEVMCVAVDVLGISHDKLVGTSRRADVVAARHIAMYVARQLTDASYPQIGASFGRGHTTFIHACSRVRARINIDDRDTLNMVNTLAWRCLASHPPR